MERKDILEEYEAKKHVFSLVSLLDFCCRFKYDESDKDENYRHGLDVVLHQYQLQSLRWMMEEENDPIGFHRHFYKVGQFEDGTPFHYSALFKRIVVDGKVPVVHGGFLCEEMVCSLCSCLQGPSLLHVS